MGGGLGGPGTAARTDYTGGTRVKYLVERRGAGEEASEQRYGVVTAGGCGPCSFGMYEAEYRKALRDAGFDRFRVLLFDQQGGLSQGAGDEALEINLKLGFGLLKAIIVGDMINDVGCKIRPYEVHSGETDRVIEEAQAILGNTLREGTSVYRSLRRIRKMFDAVEVDCTRVKPMVRSPTNFGHRLPKATVTTTCSAGWSPRAQR